MEVCRTDVKNICRFLREASELYEEEALRRNHGKLRFQNHARLMRLLAKKLNDKMKNSR